jgi:hypothetical protein
MRKNWAPLEMQEMKTITKPLYKLTCGERRQNSRFSVGRRVLVILSLDLLTAYADMFTL